MLSVCHDSRYHADIGKHILTIFKDSLLSFISLTFISILLFKIANTINITGEKKLKLLNRPYHVTYYRYVIGSHTSSNV